MSAASAVPKANLQVEFTGSHMVRDYSMAAIIVNFPTINKSFTAFMPTFNTTEKRFVQITGNDRVFDIIRISVEALRAIQVVAVYACDITDKTTIGPAPNTINVAFDTSELEADVNYRLSCINFHDIPRGTQYVTSSLHKVSPADEPTMNYNDWVAGSQKTRDDRAAICKSALTTAQKIDLLPHLDAIGSIETGPINADLQEYSLAMLQGMQEMVIEKYAEDDFEGDFTTDIDKCLGYINMRVALCKIKRAIELKTSQ
ncbi:MAG: hypothetical protein P0S94_04055 [Simkaniaceae bacterium]|nr:hypothetical protein [Simkaniaceae bacterium]